MLADGGAGAVDPIHPCELWTFENRESLRQGARLTSGDPLGPHERLLGRDVRACVSSSLDAGGQVEVLSRTPAFLKQADSSGPRVVVTLNGYAGDCGWQMPTPYLLVTGASFDRLTASERHYRAACGTREVVRVVSQPTIADSSNNLMAGFMGLDTRELLPPFPPTGRGEDVLFGLLLSLCLPGACIGHLPWAMLHSPIDARHFPPGALVRGVLGIDLLTVVAACLDSIAATGLPADAAGRMRSVGQQLQHIGSMPPDAADRFLRREVMKTVRRRMAALEERLAGTRGEPSFWAADVREVLRSLTHASRQSTYHLPVEYSQQTGQTVTIDRTLSYLRRFGALLDAWPDLVKSSRMMRECGNEWAVAFEHGTEHPC
jgi:hypothetical protein